MRNVLFLIMLFLVSCSTSPPVPVAPVKQVVVDMTESPTQDWLHHKKDFMAKHENRLADISSELNRLTNSKFKISKNGRNVIFNAVKTCNEQILVIKEKLILLKDVAHKQWANDEKEVTILMDTLESDFARTRKMFRR